jgi:hypothetical protein
MKVFKNVGQLESQSGRQFSLGQAIDFEGEWGFKYDNMINDCIRSERWADALLMAQMFGSSEVVKKVQELYI